LLIQFSKLSHKLAARLAQRQPAVDISPASVTYGEEDTKLGLASSLEETAPDSSARPPVGSPGSRARLSATVLLLRQAEQRQQADEPFFLVQLSMLLFELSRPDAELVGYLGRR
jgi:hypothetical protein